MFIDFFMTVRKAKVPCSVSEYLDLIAMVEKNLAFADLDDFYVLAKMCLVKDERHYDRFDKAFGHYFEGIESLDLAMDDPSIPDDWMRKEMERIMSQEEMDAIKGLGDLDEIIEAFKERLENQKKRHQGGNKNIGTGGTSPFGANGFNPEGFRIEQGDRKSVV